VLALGAAAVVEVSMLLATTVFLLPRLPPWLTTTASGMAAAVAPSELQHGKGQQQQQQQGLQKN
jgi:hypothetical protein